MPRKLIDEQGRSWQLELEEKDQRTLVRFIPSDESLDECEICVVGAVEALPELEKEELLLALDAAQNQLGYLFVDRDDRVWWVETPDEDPVAEGMALTFSRQTDEFHHPGPLPAPPDELNEDELQELLDQTLGRVIG